MFGRTIVGDFTFSGETTASMSCRRCGELSACVVSESDGSRERKTVVALSRFAAVTTTVGDAGNGGGCAADGVADAEFVNTGAAIVAAAFVFDGVLAKLAVATTFDVTVFVVFALADDSAPSSFVVSVVVCLVVGFVAFAVHCKKK